METLKPLSEFFSAIENDGRISVTHIGMYAALLQFWKDQQYANPMQVFSHQIMRLAKISSSATYHKRIKDLNDFGFIRYEPSYKRNAASKIFFRRG